MSDKFDKFRNFKNNSEEQCKKLIKEAPEICPILGAVKCKDYYFEVGVVYVSNPAYYAFTIPQWEKDSKIFTYVSIDMDDDFSREAIFIDLEELLYAGWTIGELEQLYEIKIEGI